MLRRVVFGIFSLIGIATAAAAAMACAAAIDGSGSWGVAVYAVLKSIVATAFVVLVAIRPDSRRPSRDPLAFAACIMAIAPGLALQPPADNAAGAWNVVAGEALTIAGGLWMIFSIVYLGRCFGVLPEARGLVTRGPYGLIRHPLYLGELTAFAGLVIASPRTLNVLAGAVFAIGQASRMRMEERALTEAFPEYAAYASVTPRLIPRMARRSRNAVGVPREVPATPTVGVQ